MRIAFFGHFGSMNSGNESTLLAILSRLRLQFPGSEFFCICTNPAYVGARDQIEAVPITTRAIRIWDPRAPLDKRLKSALIGVSQELNEYVRAFRMLKGTDFLIMPGTGLLTDAFGLSGWGPHNLFKWTLMAKLRGTRVFFVSVGAGPTYRALGRLLVRSTLRLADYRSYRDESSKNYLTDIGLETARDPVYPDLVFSLPESFLPSSRRRPTTRRVVGLGLMVYAENYSIANPNRETYPTYLESLVVFVNWLLAHDYDVRLLLGDGDTRVIDDFTSLLRTRLRTFDEERISYQPTSSIQGILDQIAATDVVVATRFHNLILAFLLHKPVIAISFHHKCTSLMSEMGLSAYCHDIGDMDSDKLIGQFRALEESAGNVTDLIRERVGAFRVALDEQYRRLFSGF